MHAVGLLNSALSRVNGLAATFSSLELRSILVNSDRDEPIIKDMVAVETQRTESEIIDALEDLDGEALTQTLRALDELRNARDAFLLVSDDSPLRAKQHVCRAVSAMSSAIATIKDEQLPSFRCQVTVGNQR